MGKIYEGMFLLDNQRVREDWKQAKAVVTGTLEKHGCKVHTSRRWDERKLAYPIRSKQRATYLLTYYEAEPGLLPAMRRDFDLNENVLRYLNLSADGVPEQEIELSSAENADGFTIPEPPADDAPDPEEAIDERSDRDRRDRRDSGSDDDDNDDESSDSESPARPRERTAAPRAEAEPKAEAAQDPGTEEGAGTSQEG